MSHPVFGNINKDSIKQVSLHKQIETLSTLKNQLSKFSNDNRPTDALSDDMLFEQVKSFIWFF